MRNQTERESGGQIAHCPLTHEGVTSLPASSINDVPKDGQSAAIAEGREMMTSLPITVIVNAHLDNPLLGLFDVLSRLVVGRAEGARTGTRCASRPHQQIQPPKSICGNEG